MTFATSINSKKQIIAGSHRICTASETLAKVLPLARDFGVTRIADVTGLDRIGIPVTLAIRPNSKSVAVSQGKGITLDHAKVSALMESIEIWHAENIEIPVLYGKKSDLERQHTFVDTDALAVVPGWKFEEDMPLLWCHSIDIVTDEAKLVPYELVHADYTRPVQPMHGCFPASTNGLASGNNTIEAVCHAISEIVERDALSIWHFLPFDEKKARRIDPATIDCKECLKLLERVESAGIEYGIWNITTDISIASVMCIIRDRGVVNGHLGLGSGTHVDRSVALRRAITEAAQTRLNYISGARDDLDPGEFEQSGIDAKYEFSEAYFDGYSCPDSFLNLPTKTRLTLDEDLEDLLIALNDVGINEVCWTDLTRSEFGISVARVVIPGLETPHDDSNYMPGPRAMRIMSNG